MRFEALEGKKRKTRRSAPCTARHEGFVSPQEARDPGRHVCFSLASYGVLKVEKTVRRRRDLDLKPNRRGRASVSATLGATKGPSFKACDTAVPQLLAPESGRGRSTPPARAGSSYSATASCALVTRFETASETGNLIGSKSELFCEAVVLDSRRKKSRHGPIFKALRNERIPRFRFRDGQRHVNRVT